MIDSSPFLIENGVLLDYDGTDAELVIPDGIREIGEKAFAAFRSLRKRTDTDGTVRTGVIPLHWTNTSLRSAVLPEGVPP